MYCVKDVISSGTCIYVYMFVFRAQHRKGHLHTRVDGLRLPGAEVHHRMGEESTRYLVLLILVFEYRAYDL